MNEKENKLTDLRKTPAFERMRNFLASYKNCKRVCDCYEEEKKLGLVNAKDKEIRDAFYNECKIRCHTVEMFITTLRCSYDEKRMLRFHYVEGMSIEAASERLYVSRSTAFRISKRAEAEALLAFMKLENKQGLSERFVS